MKKYVQANRELLNYIKTSIGCQMCGYNSNPLALQLDHIDPSTKFVNKNGRRLNPSDLVYYSQATLMAEVKKCRVLCANCHSIYTHSEQRKK